ncbi:GAF domain-containing protein [Alteribacillus iranensis]|uniref:GAF domain-containing protein n=1 Tax=Alteribacillus iranensis TaxID=930128 RepID=A0A1I2CH89_9BACI|nr:GAF domain-containing protein [Alteribacillus iranensis]SFE67676.1 GAF domain-containing protein [Alteribacillus iranensis]
MFEQSAYTGNTKENNEAVLTQLTALLKGENNQVANLANASALLHQYLTDVNWTGFYLYNDGEQELTLGPFQGLPACVRIPLKKGVCGTAADERKTIRVNDVHQFPGHIACDAASRSEIVIPLIKGTHLLGVLDIDSPSYHRFTEEDEKFLEKYVATLIEFL